MQCCTCSPQVHQTTKRNKTDRKDAKWICDLFMCDTNKPSFIPPAEIRHLRDLVRYRFKLTNMLTGEKNRAQNCLTVSNLKLDDVFSDVFGKSSRSITEYILAHPGETFDVSPCVDKRCKPPIEEIQAAVDGAVSPEQAIKLRQCLDHIDGLEKHKKAIIAICRMLLTTIWHVLTDLKPYTAEGYLAPRPVKKGKILTTSQALILPKLRGYIIKDDPLVAVF